MENYEIWQKAIRGAGSQSEIARAVGVTRQAVSRTIKLGRGVPPKWVLKIEAVSGVSKHILNPDVFGEENG